MGYFKHTIDYFVVEPYTYADLFISYMISYDVAKN